MSLGGDVAVAGPPPPGGWSIGVARASATPPAQADQVVAIQRGGLASSGTTTRTWKAGDRVTLRHSRSPKKVAEVLDRLHVVGTARENWPVVESKGKLVWMRGVEVDAPGLYFEGQVLPDAGAQE